MSTFLIDRAFDFWCGVSLKASNSSIALSTSKSGSPGSAAEQFRRPAMNRNPRVHASFKPLHFCFGCLP